MGEERDIEVTGGTLRAVTSGDGPHVIVLHGGPGLSDYMEGAAAELEPGYTVTRYQQRGLAPSTARGPYDISQHVDDLERVIDAVGAEKAFVVGHSWGGHLSLHALVRIPARLAGVVAVDPLGAVGDGGAAEMSRNLVERLLPENAAALERLGEDSAHGMQIAVERLRLVWPGYFADPSSAPPMPEMRLSLECNEETFSSIGAAFEKKVLEELLVSVNLPVVLLVGEKSPIPLTFGSATAALIPGARFIVEKGCGHLPWIEKPGCLRAALQEIA